MPGEQLGLALIDATTSAFQPDQVAPNKDETCSMSETVTPDSNVGHAAASGTGRATSGSACSATGNRARLKDHRVAVTAIIERGYGKTFYFHDPNGIRLQIELKRAPAL